MNESQDKQFMPITLALVSIILFTLMVSFAAFICLLKAITLILHCMAFRVAIYTCAMQMQTECNFVRF